jgi:multiple sugar transport system permease protein
MLAVCIMSITSLRRFFQLALYAPAVLSSVVAALIWLLIFDPRGLANQAMNALLGTYGVNYKWLSDTTMLRLSTIIVYFWKYVGYFTVLFVSGIGAIPRPSMRPPSLTEPTAGSCSGGSPFRCSSPQPCWFRS